MGRRRSILLGSAFSAVSLLLGPRLGSLRRGLSRKNGVRRCHGGSLGAFAGTPCSVSPIVESPASEAAEAAGDERGEDSSASQ
ncbi:MAG: hypothetical protein ACLQUT_06055 [Thermoleophilia bacterium]